MMTVSVYTQTGCGPCKLFKMWLRVEEIPYEEKNISENKDHLEEFLAFKAKGVPFTLIEEEGHQTQYMGATSTLKNELRRRKEAKQPKL